MPWSAAPMAYSPIRPKSQISNVGHLGHDSTLSIRNFILMVEEIKNPNLEANGELAHTSHHPASGKSPKFLT
jgi:hypothetical protein